MKENVDKHIEDLVGKAMRKSSLEQPSYDFTANVMSKVEGLNKSVVTTYQPLISKWAWGLIATAFVVFMVFIFLTSKPEASDWFNQINFDQVNTDKFLNILKGMRPSRFTAYGIGLLAIMILIQVSYLKNYFDKRFLK